MSSGTAENNAPVSQGGHQSVGKDAVILMVSKILTMVFSLIAVMLLSRFRTLDEYGTYSQIQTVTNLSVSIFLLGLPNCINYFLPRAFDDKKKDQLISTYFLIASGLSIAAGFILLLILPLIERFYSNPILGDFAYAFAILPWGNVAFGSLSNLLVASNKTKRVIVINLVYSMLTVLVVIAAAHGENAFAFFMALYVLLQCVFGFVTYYEATRVMTKKRIAFDWCLIKPLFSYSIPIGFAGAVGTIGLELGKLIVGSMLDASSLAIYANASKELPLAFIASSFTAVLLPVMSRLFSIGENEEAVGLWGKSIEFSYAIICFIVAALIAFAPQAMSFLYSEKYLSGVPVFCVSCLVLLFRTTYFGMVLNATGNTKQIFWSSIISLGVNAVLCIVLTPSLALLGPAIASLAAIAAITAFQLLYSARVLAMPIRKMLPWKRVGVLTLANSFILVIMMAINYGANLGTDFAGVAAALTIAGVSFLIYLLALRKRLLTIWHELR